MRSRFALERIRCIRWSDHLLLSSVLAVTTVACDSDETAKSGCRPACAEGQACFVDQCLPMTGCLRDPSTCAAGATCQRVGDAFACVCPTGYAGDGTTCDDVDECAENLDDCAEAAACENTAGGYLCSCPGGFAGDGSVCVDVDECLFGAGPCGADAVCTNTVGSYSCACLSGYERVDDACANIDECSRGTDDCSDDATCQDVDGGYICTCRDGYAGNGVFCVDVDECAEGLDDCDANAACLNRVGGYDCQCHIGFTDESGICTPAFGDFTYRRELRVLSTANGAVADAELLIELDTETLIGAAKMQEDCLDLRVADTDGATLLPYWIEGGCGTTATQIWIRLPSLPTGESTLFLYYGDPGAGSAAEPWTGRFTAVFEAACSGTWTANDDFLGRFPYGSSSYAVADVPSAHDHFVGNAWTTTPSLLSAVGPGTTQAASNLHIHSLSFTVSTTSSLPPYRHAAFCAASDLVLRPDLVAFFDASPPAGWATASSFLNRFPRGAADFGEVGGSTTHSHSVTVSAAASTSSTVAVATSASGPYLALATHTHVWEITVLGSHVPPYLDLIMAASAEALVAPPGIILMVDGLPPLGWDRFSALDGLIPRGALAYGDRGGTTFHNHTVGPSNTALGTEGALGTSGSTFVAYDLHSHAFTEQISSSSTNTVSQVRVVFVKKRDPRVHPGAVTLIGGEEVLR